MCSVYEPSFLSRETGVFQVRDPLRQYIHYCGDPFNKDRSMFFCVDFDIFLLY